MDNCSEVDGQSFDGQLQRSVGKADSGRASVREGSPAPGAYSRAAVHFRQAFFSAATTWTGASFAVRVSGRLDSLLSR
jgi:hypothetical protein